MSEPMSEPHVLLTGLAVGESPRWHDGRLWLCNWGTQEVVAVDPEGREPARSPVTLAASLGSSMVDGQKSLNPLTVVRPSRSVSATRSRSAQQASNTADVPGWCDGDAGNPLAADVPELVPGGRQAEEADGASGAEHEAAYLRREVTR